MNKTELIKSMAAKSGLTNAQADEAYKAFVASIVEAFNLDEYNPAIVSVADTKISRSIWNTLV